MQRNKRFSLIAISFLIAWDLNHPALIYGSCASGNAVPPFLSTGSKPNLLLMIDNSASMYDLAYVQPREEG